MKRKIIILEDSDEDDDDCCHRDGDIECLTARQCTIKHETWNSQTETEDDDKYDEIQEEEEDAKEIQDIEIEQNNETKKEDQEEKETQNIPKTPEQVEPTTLLPIDHEIAEVVSDEPVEDTKTNEEIKACTAIPWIGDIRNLGVPPPRLNPIQYTPESICGKAFSANAIRVNTKRALMGKSMGHNPDETWWISKQHWEAAQWDGVPLCNWKSCHVTK
jgi:hypothetical protein